MDPLTIIATALVAGAAAGGKDAASATVRDAYAALRDRISRHTDDSDAIAAVEANEAAPGSNAVDLQEALAAAGLNDDRELRAAAELLLTHLRPDGTATRIDLRHAKGVQVGEQNTQTNTFG